jgi:threonine aldolase
MIAMDRRFFVAASGMAALAASASRSAAAPAAAMPFESPLLLSSDGPMLSPSEFASALQHSILSTTVTDTYAEGGPTAELERFMARALQKEAAVFLPTGTLANQLAIRILAGGKPSVVVQDQSHVFRDEHDMAQIMSGKTLINLAPNQASFSAQEFQDTLTRHAGQVGAVSIESPVRRQMSERFDFAEMQSISRIARRHDIGLHLDGARLFIESVYSGIPVSAYAALFDTIYICLYKCFGAGSGALLCGSRAHIEAALRLRSLFGARMFKTWPFSAVALRIADGFERRLSLVKVRAERFFDRLNDSGAVKVLPVERGTNVYRFTAQGADPESVRKRVAGEGIRWSSFGFTPEYGLFRVNETWAAMNEEAVFQRIMRSLA